MTVATRPLETYQGRAIRQTEKKPGADVASRSDANGTPANTGTLAPFLVEDALQLDAQLSIAGTSASGSYWSGTLTQTNDTDGTAVLNFTWHSKVWTTPAIPVNATLAQALAAMNAATTTTTAATYAVQTIHISQGTPQTSTGSIVLSFRWGGVTYTTASIAFGAAGSAVQSALRAAVGPNGEALPANAFTVSGAVLGTNDIVCTAAGGLTGPVTNLTMTITQGTGILIAGTWLQSVAGVAAVTAGLPDVFTATGGPLASAPVVFVASGLLTGAIGTLGITVTGSMTGTFAQTNSDTGAAVTGSISLTLQTSVDGTNYWTTGPTLVVNGSGYEANGSASFGPLGIWAKWIPAVTTNGGGKVTWAIDTQAVIGV